MSLFNKNKKITKVILEKLEQSYRKLFPEDFSEQEYKNKYGNDVDFDLATKMECDIDFQEAMQKSFPNEGGYNNDPRDAGGETNFGISELTYPDEPKKDLKQTRAEYIYYRDFYNYPGYDNLPADLRGQVFDAAIYKGQPTAAKLLQKMVGAEPDGLIGPKTRAKIDDMNKYQLSEDFFYALNEDNERSILETPEKEAFRKGWYNRNKRMIIKH